MTLDDLDLLKDVDDPRVSPDGKWVAYTVEANDKESDSGIADLWMVSWDGSQDIRLTWNYDASVSEPRWSPDGRYSRFLSDREGAPKVEGAQVWLLDRRGGEAHQLTAIKGQTRRLRMVARFEEAAAHHHRNPRGEEGKSQRQESQKPI